MVIAAADVKPDITGTDTKRTKKPNLRIPIANKISPT